MIKFMTSTELVEIYAEAWRKLDAKIVEPYLDEFFKYSSFWVFETLDREKYIEYLSGKFSAIKSSNTAPAVSTGYDKTGSPCVILKQGNEAPACITVRTNCDKIVEGYMIPFSIVCG